MYKIQTLALSILFMVPLVQYAQHTDEINSNRPGESMSAFAIGKKVIQVETGVYGIEESDDQPKYNAAGVGADFVLRYGAFFEKLEIIADIQYQMGQFDYPNASSVQKTDFRQINLGAKYLIYDPFKNYKKVIDVTSWKANHKFNWRQFLPVFSVFAGVNYATKNNPYYFSPDGGVSPKIMLITQNHLGDGSVVFVTNFIADYIGTDSPNYGYVITLTKGFTREWSAFVENQLYSSNFKKDFIIRGGAAYSLSKNMQIDASIGGNFVNTYSSFFGGVGLSWRFDDKYKPEKIDIDDKKGKGKGKSKGKSKGKDSGKAKK